MTCLSRGDELISLCMRKDEVDHNEWERVLTLVVHDTVSWKGKQTLALNVPDGFLRTDGVAVLNDEVYVGLQNAGMAVFSLHEGSARAIGEKEGLPGVSVQSLCAFQNRIYLFLAEALVTARVKSRTQFLEYDPPGHKFRTLAGEATAEKQSALDGLALDGGILIADTNRIWLQATEWSLDPTGHGHSGKTRLWNSPAGEIKMVEVPEAKQVDPIICRANPTELARMVAMGLWPTHDTVYDRDGRAVFPLDAPMDNQRPGCMGLTYDGRGMMVALLSVLQDQYRVVRCTSKEGRTAIIRKLLDGRPASTVKLLAGIEGGVLAVCDDGAAFLIKRKLSQ